MEIVKTVNGGNWLIFSQSGFDTLLYWANLYGRVLRYGVGYGGEYYLDAVE